MLPPAKDGTCADGVKCAFEPFQYHPAEFPDESESCIGGLKMTLADGSGFNCLGLHPVSANAVEGACSWLHDRVPLYEYECIFQMHLERRR
jgi:hypothetical protein